MADFFSFEDVMGELHLDEDELKRMVSEGELRAFRDDNKMKFRKDDVESLKRGKTTEPTIVLPGEGGGGGDSEGTILDLDSSDTAPPPEDTAVPSIDFGESDTGVQEAAQAAAEPAVDPNSETGDTTGITEEMVFEDSDLKVHKSEDQGLGGGESSETFVEDSSSTGGVTEPLQLQAEGGAAEEAGETVAEEAGAEAKPRRKLQRAPAGAAAAAPKGSPAWTIMLVAATVFLGLVGYFYYDLIRIITTPNLAKPTNMTKSVREILVSKQDMTTKPDPK